MTTDETPPPIPANKDAGHLKLLAIFHFIFAGLGLLGYLFLGLHYAFMNMMFNNPEMWKGKDGKEGRPPPPEMFMFFKIFYIVFAIFLTVGILMNLLSGLFLRKRKNRLFSMIVAGIDCLQMPLGTILGVFTLVVLNRDSVAEAYSKKTPSATPTK